MTVVFRPYRPTPAERAALLAAGWRVAGDQWYPPWPCRYSYTAQAALLQQEQGELENWLLKKRRDAEQSALSAPGGHIGGNFPPIRS
jgi:hypothetical protein